ncbi:hypothetical protein OQA88_13477 [Cercophora sp. LCS_1]
MAAAVAPPSLYYGGSDARYRDVESTSSSSSDVGTFFVSNVRRRVAAPPPKPLPVASGYSPACEKVHAFFSKYFKAGVSEVVGGIARHAEVDILDVDIVVRMPVGDGGDRPDPKTLPPTILIVAKWTGNESHARWEKVVTETKKLLDPAVKSATEGRAEVRVEMVDLELTLPKFITPIGGTEYSGALSNDWPNIMDRVNRILTSHGTTKSRVNIVALFKWGTNKDAEKNPPTVFIGVDYQSEETKWPPILDEIQHFLDGYPYKLRLHMEHNATVGHLKPFERLVNKTWGDVDDTDMLRLRGFDPIEQHYTKAVDIGDDIGPAKYHEVPNDGRKLFGGLGTLGCWVEVRTASEPKVWTKLALTNWHVVRPGFDGFRLGRDKDGNAVAIAPERDSDLEKADINGYRAGTLGKVPTEIESPTRRRHAWALDTLEKMVKSVPEKAKELKEAIIPKKLFFDNNHQIFGVVYLASGYLRRTKTNGRLDWALLRPLGESRLGKNVLPTWSDWRKRGYTDVPGLFTDEKTDRPPYLKQPPKQSLRNPVPDKTIVYKVGATTGPTAGVFMYQKATVKIADDAYLFGAPSRGISENSTEFVYMRLPQLRNGVVGKKGDSGSVAFDRHGCALGLLFRGYQAQDSAEHVFITPIEDVFEDIKAFSKGKILEIRIAEFPPPSTKS